MKFGFGKALIVFMPMVFGVLAYVAVSTKSPTYDEPLHLVSAYLQNHQGDFRIDPEDPPLWKYWAALPLGRDSLSMPTELSSFQQSTEDIQFEWKFVVDALYRTGDNASRSDELMMRGRAMMLLLGVGLAVVIAWWSWQIAGLTGSAVAVTLYCLCPNFLAHAPLVKNDVSLSLVTVALFLSVWRAGRKLTVWNATAVAALCAAAVTVKFSGLLLGPIVAILLLIRALDARPWETFLRRLDLRTDKLVATILLLVLAAAVSYAGIWANYLFRFGPERDPSVKLNIRQMVIYASSSELQLKYGRMPTEKEVKQWQPSLMSRAIMTMDDMHFLPQAWLNGLLYTYQSALLRMTFLLGEYSKTGWWYYFPVAIATKTPLATLCAMLLALAVLIATATLRGWRLLLAWTPLCLFIPPAIFLAVAMRSNLNLGIRHILPIYPFIFIGIGLAVVEALRRWPTYAKWTSRALLIILAVESFSAFPNYIPYFNHAAGGAAGGLRILGDSNLDWGQDLKLLRQWQLNHPGVRLHLIYFGVADPWAYQIEYSNFPSGYPFGEKYRVTAEPGVLAVSATHLQGVYIQNEQSHEILTALRSLTPIEVLGGSIYLYRWPLPNLK